MSRKRAGVEETLRLAIPKGSKFLVAFSGGIDSTALLVAVTNLCESMSWCVGVAHVDHRIRSCSEQDAARCGAFVAQLGFPFFLYEAPVDPGALLSSGEFGGAEGWGRFERYRFFRRIISSLDYEYAITAHTANDVAETFLMRLAANKETRTIHQRNARLGVMRPFLSITKEQLREYLLNTVPPDWANGICNDESNCDLKYFRNRVRHLVLPAFSATTPGPTIKILSEQAQKIAIDLEIVDLYVLDKISMLVGEEWGSRSWLSKVVKLLGSIPSPKASVREGVKWRIIEHLFLPSLGRKIGHQQSLRILKFLESGAPALSLPGSFSLMRKAGGIKIERLVRK